MGARQVVSTVQDTVRTQLWPLPVLAVVFAAAVGVLLPQLDVTVDASLPSWATSALFGGDADAARTVLDAVASSLITVTSLTFSLTVVTLQLASSQFSPRLLRTFTSDVFVQATLGLFLATFTYSLTVLRTVRGGGDGGAAPFVPKISVTLSFLLGIISVLGLVVFLAHLARRIRVETMLRDVHQDASATVQASLGERDAHQEPPALPVVPADAVTLLAPSSGFVLRFDEAALLAAATDADAVIAIDAHPGSSLVADTPIGAVFRRCEIVADDAVENVRHCVASAVRMGYERTAAQDVGYGLRQLTDVANKALSPGINDPTTAVYALGHLSALLCELAGRDLGPVVLRDDESQVRVVLHRPDLARLVDVAITQPRRYGAADPQVMARLFDLLRELAWRCHPDQHHVVTDQLNRLRATVAAQDFDTTETGQLDEAARQVERTLRRPR